MLRILLVSLIAASLAGAAEPGQDVSGWKLRTPDGRQASLAAMLEGGAALILLHAASRDSAVCDALRRLEALELQSDVRRIVVTAKGLETPSSCVPETAAVLLRMEESPQPGAVTEAIIVDDTLHVRWKAKLAAGDAGWAALAQGVNEWLQGRQAFEANCGHCHGLDGAQASSPDVKSLVGITKKYPGEKVLELGSQFGGVDMTGWNAAKRETLLTYIRGL